MPVYVYGCGCDGGHRKEITHGMFEEPAVKCLACGRLMHRIPQAFRFYNKPGDVLLDKLDRKYREMRGRKNAHK